MDLTVSNLGSARRSVAGMQAALRPSEYARVCVRARQVTWKISEDDAIANHGLLKAILVYGWAASCATEQLILSMQEVDVNWGGKLLKNGPAQARYEASSP